MDKRNKIRAGLTFGIGMTIFFILQNLYLAEDRTTTGVIKSVVTGIVTGAVTGVLYGWLIGMFAKSKLITASTKIETAPGETILFDTPANHFKGIEGVGGKLYLTNKRLIFKSHAMNAQNHLLSLDLDDISRVHPCKYLKVMNNGIAVTLANETVEKFVVEQRDSWLEHLAEKSAVNQNALS